MFLFADLHFRLILVYLLRWKAALAKWCSSFDNNEDRNFKYSVLQRITTKGGVTPPIGIAEEHFTIHFYTTSSLGRKLVFIKG